MPLLELIYLALACTPDESRRWRFGTLLLCPLLSPLCHWIAINFLTFFFKFLHCPIREIRVALPGYGTAAARAALTVHLSVCIIFVCPNSGYFLTLLLCLNCVLLCRVVSCRAYIHVSYVSYHLSYFISSASCPDPLSLSPLPSLHPSPLSVSVSLCLSVVVSVAVSVSVCLSVCLSVSVCLCLCLSLSVCLSVCLSVFLSPYVSNFVFSSHFQNPSPYGPVHLSLCVSLSTHSKVKFVFSSHFQYPAISLCLFRECIV